MAEFRLSTGEICLIDDEDLSLAADRTWRLTRRANGDEGYVTGAFRDQGRKTTKPIHRVIMQPTGDAVVDHINGNRLDNRRCNLRICTHKQNMRNRRPNRGKDHGYKGIYRRPGESRWHAQINLDGKFVRIGTFDDPQSAAVAYDRAATHHFGEYARLNFSADRDWILPQLAVATTPHSAGFRRLGARLAEAEGRRGSGIGRD